MKHISTIAKTERKSTVMGCGECQSSCQSACKTSCTVGNQTCKQEERINKSVSAIQSFAPSSPFSRPVTMCRCMVRALLL